MAQSTPVVTALLVGAGAYRIQRLTGEAEQIDNWAEHLQQHKRVCKARAQVHEAVRRYH
ncbi:MFS transporter [Lampropedia aestuarii]|uniref:MFS transporter n=1 Tax=Lampropedia aestuarii TaxID=2562762 RepID=UPI0014560B8E|nr:MFS transporter [Lampropedia aestuarii]